MEPIDRRTFLAAAGAASAAALANPASVAAAESSNDAVFLSTWKWGIEANARAAKVYAEGGSLLDAVEKGINLVEDDPNVDSVGYGGLPNAQGEVELDAGIMDGTAHRAGSVCNLHKSRIPSRSLVSLWRRRATPRWPEKAPYNSRSRWGTSRCSC